MCWIPVSAKHKNCFADIRNWQQGEHQHNMCHFGYRGHKRLQKFVKRGKKCNHNKDKHPDEKWVGSTGLRGMICGVTLSAHEPYVVRSHLGKILESDVHDRTRWKSRKRASKERKNQRKYKCRLSRFNFTNRKQE